MIQPDATTPIADMVTNARLKALVRYWQEKCGNRPMPARADIDPLEIPRLLPIVLMADASAAPARIRLLGSEATGFHGSEMKGRSIDAFNLGAFTPAWIKAFKLVTDTLCPTAAAGGYEDGARNCSVETVLLPLSNSDGKFDAIFGGLWIRPIFWDRRPIRQPVIHVLPPPLQAMNGPGTGRGARGA